MLASISKTNFIDATHNNADCTFVHIFRVSLNIGQLLPKRNLCIV